MTALPLGKDLPTGCCSLTQKHKGKQTSEVRGGKGESEKLVYFIERIIEEHPNAAKRRRSVKHRLFKSKAMGLQCTSPVF